MAEIERHDIDPQETQEWLDSLETLFDVGGPERAHYVLESLLDKARRNGANLPYELTSPYLNSIAVEDEPVMPGDQTIEARIRAAIRWNALAMVLKASNKNLELGGHIASFASSAMIYDVGFNHFFKGSDHESGGDLLFIQGHISPGIYARAYLEGRITDEQLEEFRQEVDGKGIPSYPHPHLMPDFWQFPTVSMGLGPIQAIYTARYLKYLTNRGIKDCSGQRVYCFLGDGEIDEPESLGAISLASRENLDNLTFIVNCNLQRLDGPVRGNGKIIQELEGVFRGAGWEVIKVVWGRRWDALLHKDTSGKLKEIMESTLDGEYQNYTAKGGAFKREHFFGKTEETKALVANMSDDEIFKLNRGGHDPIKMYAAYDKAINTKGKPQVILAKTVKGYGMGEAGEGKNVAHQVKNMDLDSVKHFRDRFDIPISDADIESIPFYRFPEDSEEAKYLHARRQSLGGYLPKRRQKTDKSYEVPALSTFDAVLKGSGEREISTTMAFVRILSALLRDKKIGPRVVPIVPDEARTFGMEGLFRQIGIYSSKGQQYTPQDADLVAYYREDVKGQVLQEGINELGAFASWLTAATSYSTVNEPMLPFYTYYSMFGFQRKGDLVWAAGDSHARGFLLGGTSGRTTLNGEGLQHQDGHSHVHYGTVPNCVTYDPTYGYEMAVIIHDGMRRMFGEQENVFYYITMMNENYVQPEMPEGVTEGILRGIYKLDAIQAKKPAAEVRLIGSGTILQEVRKAAQILEEKYQVSSTVFSATSFNELARDGLNVERENMLNPTKKAKQAYITEALAQGAGPVIAATDYIKLYADQVRAWVPGPYHVLGTDGFGRSDSRDNLRRHFEVNADYIVVAALSELAKAGELDAKIAEKAIKDFKIDTQKINPLYV